MPVSAYLKKMEQTCMYEDPDLLDNYTRSALKDVRPDEPFFESDVPRRQFYSVDRLNLRDGGARSYALPYLPDGTFLDHEFMGKDPRGGALDPDMKRYRSQQEARTKFIKHGNDADHSVVSSGWHPTHVVRDIRAQYYNVKDRLKIFDESMDGWTTGGKPTSDIAKVRCMQGSSDRPREMREEMCYNRRNVVNDLSNNTSIGWRRTTDHNFKIARYGLVRSGVNVRTQDWSFNRAQARLDQDLSISMEGRTATKVLTLEMIDLAKKRRVLAKAGEGAFFTESQETSNKGMSQKHQTGSAIEARQGVETRGADPHSLIGGEVVNKALIPVIKSHHGKVVINPHIVEQMVMANKTAKRKRTDDLRNEIQQAGESSAIHIEQSNSAGRGGDSGNELKWQSKDTRTCDESKKVANYSRLRKQIGKKNIAAMNYEKYGGTSKEGEQRRNVYSNELYNMDALDFDTKYGNELCREKSIGVMGSKYMRNYMVNDIDPTDMSEITC